MVVDLDHMVVESRHVWFGGVVEYLDELVMSWTMTYLFDGSWTRCIAWIDWFAGCKRPA